MCELLDVKECALDVYLKALRRSQELAGLAEEEGVGHASDVVTDDAIGRG